MNTNTGRHGNVSRELCQHRIDVLHSRVSSFPVEIRHRIALHVETQTASCAMYRGHLRMLLRREDTAFR